MGEIVEVERTGRPLVLSRPRRRTCRDRRLHGGVRRRIPSDAARLAAAVTEVPGLAGSGALMTVTDSG